MSTLISIDFDFLVPHGMYEDAVRLASGHDMPGQLVYDWQMNESRSPVFEKLLWTSRAAQFQTWGLDIRALTEPKLTPLEFVTEISVRAGGDMIPAWKADSHGWGAIVTRDFSSRFGPLNVVNFDAHHDLGYYENGKPLEDYKAKGTISCDNWALIGLHEGWIENYALVYPDWLGRAEWEGVKRTWLREYHKRITIMTWSEWLQECDELEDPQTGFLCRSSAWVPPWLDSQFAELVDEWGHVDCLDCTLQQSGSAHDVCKLREWDWTEVEEEIKVRNEIFAELERRQSCTQ